MSGINQVTIVGRLGQDPEVRYTQSGAAVANVSVATSEKWKDKNSGEQQERTEWHRIVAFGKTAEIIGEHMCKGDLHAFMGKIRTRKWQDQSGQDRYTTEIHADRIEFLQSKDPAGSRPPRQQSQPQQQAAPQQQSSASRPELFEDFDDDIPF